MLTKEQIIYEINLIPSDKLVELYDLIHYFRLGLLKERQTMTQENKYPLLGKPVHYQDPFEPVLIQDR